ncbi:MAG TPA: hypothetical protein VNH64_00310 [Parvularculaceae bacterium]|nr:hypothetical protein [Parvularculaceae bacterium]
MGLPYSDQMSSRWTGRIAGLNPAVVTILFLVLFFGVGISLHIPSTGARVFRAIWAVGNAIFLGSLLLWHYSLFEAADKRSAQQLGAKPRRPLPFIVCATAMAAFILIVAFARASGGPSETSDPAILGAIFPALMALGVLSYFAAIWSAADALMRAELKRSSVPWHMSVGTFLLEFYLPIGIWFLHKRIRQALAPSPAI